MKKYQQIEAILAQRIADGTYAAGMSLPTHETLCGEFATSRSQLHRILGSLETRGLITRTRGKSGTVNPPPRRKTLLYLFFAATPGYPISEAGTPGQLYRGVDRFATEFGYDLIVQSGDSFLRGDSIPPGVDAVLAGGADVDLHFDRLAGQRVPLVVFGPYHTLDCDTFMPDYNEVGERSAVAVLRNGFRRPLFVTLQYERQNRVLGAYRRMYHALDDYFDRFARDIRPGFAVLQHHDLVTNGDGIAALQRKITEFQPDVLIYSETILYNPLSRLEPFAGLPAVVCDRPQPLDPRVIEYTGVDLEELGYAAGVRLDERVRQPDLPMLRRLFPVAGTMEEGR